MAFVDMATYRAACSKARELVDPVSLLDAIHRVYDMWISDKEAGVRIDFHKYFGLSLLDMGIDSSFPDELFVAEQYRKALAAYFQPRALRRLAELRAAAEETSVPVQNNNVEFANKQRVRIRIDEQVSLQFRATRRAGPLKWIHVDEEFKVIHSGDGILEDTDRHRARKQALQVLNSVRKRQTKKKRFS